MDCVELFVPLDSVDKNELMFMEIQVNDKEDSHNRYLEIYNCMKHHTKHLTGNLQNIMMFGS